MVSAN